MTVIIVYYALQMLTSLVNVQLIYFMLYVKIFLMQIIYVLQKCSFATFLIKQYSSIIFY